MSKIEKEYFLSLFLSKDFYNNMQFYNYYKNIKNDYPLRSYFTINKYLNDSNIIKNNYVDSVVIGKIQDEESFYTKYFAYDISNNEYLYFFDSIDDEIVIQMKMLLFLYKKYKQIYLLQLSFISSRNLKHKLIIDFCNKLGIELKFNKALSKKVYSLISFNDNIKNKEILRIDYSKENIIIKSVERKIINSNNVFQYNNTRYKIFSNKSINIFSKVNVLFYLDNDLPKVQYNGEIYSTNKIMDLISKKKCD